MPQIFRPGSNTLSRLTIFGAMVVVIGLMFLSYLFMQSPYQTQVRVIRPQPVPFSQEHHVAGLAIDCRYCHTSVETSSFGGFRNPGQVRHPHRSIVDLPQNGYDEARNPPAFGVRTLTFGIGSSSDA